MYSDPSGHRWDPIKAIATAAKNIVEGAKNVVVNTASWVKK